MEVIFYTGSEEEIEGTEYVVMPCDTVQTGLTNRPDSQDVKQTGSFDIDERIIFHGREKLKGGTNVMIRQSSMGVRKHFSK